MLGIFKSKEDKERVKRQEILNAKLEKNRKRLERQQRFDNGMVGDKTKKIMPYNKDIVINFQNNNRGWIYCYQDNYEDIISDIYDKIINKEVGKLYFNRYFNGSVLMEYNIEKTIRYDSIVSVSDDSNY